MTMSDPELERTPMTNDAERVSDIVARLRPSFVTDLPVVHANSKCRDENTAASLSTWLIANNALKTEAADIIEAQSKALAEARATHPAAVAVTDEMAEIAGAVIENEVGVFADMSRGFYPWLARQALEAALTPTPENPNG